MQTNVNSPEKIDTGANKNSLGTGNADGSFPKRVLSINKVTAYGNAYATDGKILDLTTYDDIFKYSTNYRDHPTEIYNQPGRQYKGRGNLDLIPNFSAAFNNKKLWGSYVQIINTLTNQPIKSLYGNGVFRVDDTGGSSVDSRLDLYAGSDRTVYKYFESLDGVPLIISEVNSQDALVPTAEEINAAKLVAIQDRNLAYDMPDETIGHFGSANGVASIPAVGSKVWVFFLGGDPQRPVYFAQVADNQSHAPTYQTPKVSEPTTQNIVIHGEATTDTSNEPFGNGKGPLASKTTTTTSTTTDPITFTTRSVTDSSQSIITDITTTDIRGQIISQTTDTSPKNKPDGTPFNNVSVKTTPPISKFIARPPNQT